MARWSAVISFLRRKLRNIQGIFVRSITSDLRCYLQGANSAEAELPALFSVVYRGSLAG